jgi:hypothetical protein
MSSEDNRRIIRLGRTDGDKHVNVDLPVLEGIPEVLAVVLIRQRRPILLEPRLDFSPLFRRQKSRTAYPQSGDADQHGYHPQRQTGRATYVSGLS